MVASSPLPSHIMMLAATVHKCEPTMEARESMAAALQERNGAAFIPPYNHGAVICGQGTMALELMEQVRMMAPGPSG